MHTNMESKLNESLSHSGCVDCKDDSEDGPFINFVWYITLSCSGLVIVIILMTVGRLIQIGQKTRNTQQRRPYMNSRQRASLSQTEPTIYVSPANLPPPPKYEVMPPPSYEEVVGIHYPSYQPPVQPITLPISSALAQGSNTTDANVTSNESQNNATENVTSPSNVRNNEPSTVITVTNER